MERTLALRRRLRQGAVGGKGSEEDAGEHRGDDAGPPAAVTNPKETHLHHRDAAKGEGVAGSVEDTVVRECVTRCCHSRGVASIACAEVACPHPQARVTASESEAQGHTGQVRGGETRRGSDAAQRYTLSLVSHSVITVAFQPTWAKGNFIERNMAVGFPY